MLHFNKDRPIQVTCLGRLAVDFYAEEFGASLERSQSFRKYLGGSSGNQAFGAARLGVRTALISRVGLEQNGKFLLNELKEVGCDTSQITEDPGRLTGVVFLSLQNEQEFPLLFYRKDCADMGLRAEHISEEFIASTGLLVITGTHLSCEGVKDASLKALTLARSHRVKTVLDIDYRPVLWGLTKAGEGDNRYVASEAVTRALQAMLPYFDMVVGTVEEFAILGGQGIEPAENVACLRAKHPEKIFIVKNGGSGAWVVEPDQPLDLTPQKLIPGYPVKVKNLLGAGDAFMAGLLKGIVEGKTLEESVSWGNGCGALVVSRHGCAPETPSFEELNYFIENVNRAEERERLHRQTMHASAEKTEKTLAVLAFDHRKQLYLWAREEKKTHDEIENTLKKMKQLIYRSFVESMIVTHPWQKGFICDDLWGRENLLCNNKRELPFWEARPLELSGSNPLAFQFKEENLGMYLNSIPKTTTLKILSFYHPENETSLCVEEERKIKEVYRTTLKTGHKLLLEIIPKSTRGSSINRGDALYLSIKRLLNKGIFPEYWKIPFENRENWSSISKLLEERDPHCLGLMLLGENRKASVLAQELHWIKKHTANFRGFAVGRSLFAEAAGDWLKETVGREADERFVHRVKENYESFMKIVQGEENSE